MNLEVIYEDPDFLVINKPAGISTHKSHANDPNISIADMVVEKYPEVQSVGEDPIRPGIVHRLDKDTSGVMIIAKTNSAFFYFKNLFQSREMKKQYLALVHGCPKELKGIIDAPLGKVGTKQTTQIKGKKELVERQALTEYQVIKKFQDYSLIEVMPKTGRTHQIRIHLKSIGCPIVGDDIYGIKDNSSYGLFLHAQRLDFTTPDGKSMAIEADPPEGFQQFVETLDKNS